MKRYVAGDEGTFQEIVNQYPDSVYAFLRRFLNNRDFVDEAFWNKTFKLADAELVK